MATKDTTIIPPQLLTPRQDKEKERDVSPLCEEIMLLRQKTRVWVAVADDSISTSKWFGGSLYLQRSTQKMYFEHILLSIRRLTDRPRKDDVAVMNSLYNELKKRGYEKEAEDLSNNTDIRVIRTQVDNLIAHPLAEKIEAALEKISDIKPEHKQNQSIFKAVALISSMFFEFIEDNRPPEKVQINDPFLWSIRHEGIPFIDFPIEQIYLSNRENQ